MGYTQAHRYFRTKSDKEMRDKLLALLERRSWRIPRVARELGVHRVSLYRILRSDERLTRAFASARIKSSR